MGAVRRRRRGETERVRCGRGGEWRLCLGLVDEEGEARGRVFQLWPTCQ